MFENLYCERWGGRFTVTRTSKSGKSTTTVVKQRSTMADGRKVSRTNYLRGKNRLVE